MYKKLTIKVSKGETTEEINKALTPNDRPITERIKTFEDAVEELGDWHPLVTEYKLIAGTFDITDNLLAYLKLRIICKALNEEWKPTLNEDEYRYYPWFDIYTQSEYEAFNNNEKRQCFSLKPYHNITAFSAIRCTGTHSARSCSYIVYGIWFTFKTGKLAEYCGKQFIDIWCDYLLG